MYTQKVYNQIVQLFDLNEHVVGRQTKIDALSFLNVTEPEMALEVFFLETLNNKQADKLIFNKKMTPQVLLDIANSLDTKDDWCNVTQDGFWDMYRETFSRLSKQTYFE